jgi:hypothetical protein
MLARDRSHGNYEKCKDRKIWRTLKATLSVAWLSRSRKCTIYVYQWLIFRVWSRFRETWKGVKTEIFHSSSSSKSRNWNCVLASWHYVTLDSFDKIHCFILSYRTIIDYCHLWIKTHLVLPTNCWAQHTWKQVLFRELFAPVRVRNLAVVQWSWHLF